MRRKKSLGRGRQQEEVHTSHFETRVRSKSQANATLQGGAAIITDLLAFLGGWTKNRIDDLLGGRARMGDVTRSHRNTLTTLHP